MASLLGRGLASLGVLVLPRVALAADVGEVALIPDDGAIASSGIPGPIT